MGVLFNTNDYKVVNVIKSLEDARCSLIAKAQPPPIPEESSLLLEPISSPNSLCLMDTEDLHADSKLTSSKKKSSTKQHVKVVNLCNRKRES